MKRKTIQGRILVLSAAPPKAKAGVMAANMPSIKLFPIQDKIDIVYLDTQQRLFQVYWYC